MATGTVLLDVDGTLVDSAWLHTLAWQRACRRHDLDVPAWRIADRIGMGGDVLVADLLGDDVEERLGDDLRAAWGEEVEPLLDELRPLPGAADLVRELARRGVDCRARELRREAAHRPVYDDPAALLADLDAALATARPDDD